MEPDEGRAQGGGIPTSVRAANGYGDVADRKLAAYFVPENGSRPSRGSCASSRTRQLPDCYDPGGVSPVAGAAADFQRQAGSCPAAGSDARAGAERNSRTGPRNRRWKFRWRGSWRSCCNWIGWGWTGQFFLLGGHSLLGTQLASRARERFGVESYAAASCSRDADGGEAGGGNRTADYREVGQHAGRGSSLVAGAGGERAERDRVLTMAKRDSMASIEQFLRRQTPDCWNGTCAAKWRDRIGSCRCRCAQARRFRRRWLWGQAALAAARADGAGDSDIQRVGDGSIFGEAGPGGVRAGVPGGSAAAMKSGARGSLR